MLRVIDTCTWGEYGTPLRDGGTGSLHTESIFAHPTSPLPTPPRRLVTERHVDLHPVLRHHRLPKHLPRFLDELFRADRIAGRDVAQDETLRIRGERSEEHTSELQSLA